jgi:hypothetical protein
MEQTYKKNTKLDTLAQLRKRAVRKYLQQAKLEELKTFADSLNDNSKMYDRSLKCSHILKQDGKKITSIYCKQRCCNICNSIRSATLINNYQEAINKMREPYFITLTTRNKKEDWNLLRARIISMNETIRKIANNGRNLKHKILLTGIRKIETTYNITMDWFHPHYHFIIDGEIEAKWLVQQWLIYNPTASEIAQKCEPATQGALEELFKYSVKETDNVEDEEKRIPIPALHHIYKTLKNIRTFQTMGNFSAVEIDEEEMPELVSQECNEIEEDNTYWKWEDNNWWNIKTGERLINEEITIKTKIKDESMFTLSG